MKKILLGLVISLMMTGSGYAEGPFKDKNMNSIKFNDHCNFLKAHAIREARSAMNSYNIYVDAYDEFVNADRKTYQKYERALRDNMYSAEKSKKIKPEIYYFAVTWSALCD